MGLIVKLAAQWKGSMKPPSGLRVWGGSKLWKKNKKKGWIEMEND